MLSRKATRDFGKLARNAPFSTTFLPEHCGSPSVFPLLSVSPEDPPVTQLPAGPKGPTFCEQYELGTLPFKPTLTFLGRSPPAGYCR
jgi:hypothetical protein